MRTLTVLFVLFAAVSSVAAAEATSEKPPAAPKPKPEAPAEGPFTFRIERAVPEYEGYHVWGMIKSTQPGRSVKDVSVVLTAYDAEGKFLGRAIAQPSGSDAGHGDVGYVNDCNIPTGKQMPAKVETKIIAPPTYDGIEVVRSPDRTAGDVPLEFQLQKIGIGYGGLQVWGKVTSSIAQDFEGVTVIVSLYGPDGKFLGRGKESVTPSKLTKGQVGYVDSLSIEVGPWRPARLEWKVVSGRD